MLGPAQGFLDGLAGKATILQKAHLLGPFGRGLGQLAKFSCPNCLTTFNFVAAFGQSSGDFLVADATLAQLLAQAGIAVTAGTHCNALIGVALIGQQAFSLQPIEHGVEFLGRLGFAGKLGAQLCPAMIAPGQQLQGADAQFSHQPGPTWSA